MSRDPVAARYAQALFELAKAGGQVDEARAALRAVGRLAAGHAELRQFLVNPDVEPDQKLDLLRRTLGAQMTPLASAFIRLVVSYGRAASLAAIVEAFEAAVDEDQGRLRLVVRSAHPLPEALVKRIAHQVERREGKTAQVEAEVDPSLIGGLQVVLDHRVIDGSVQRHLTDLRQRLRAVRVA
jgi:F-type H+-transporting ATPase subunit delta